MSLWNRFIGFLKIHKNKKFHESWNYLLEHDLFNINGINCFNSLLYIEVVRVNPVTLEIDGDNKKNTLVQVWIETGEWVMPEDMPEEDRWTIPETGIQNHDYELDCGGDTFEEAIIELAKLVKQKYG